MKQNQKVLIAVVGPTGIGKSRTAITLAKHFGTEILSADSRQFYKEMTIGTAVPSSKELSEVVHHFIQHKSIADRYTVGDYEKEALALLNQLFEKKDIVLMAGGSGLFVESVAFGLNEFPKVPQQIRNDLNAKMVSEGLASLQKELKKLDPTTYKSIDLQNPKRVIRALEISISTGKPFSNFKNKPLPIRNFTTLFVSLEAPRKLLYDRINTRVDEMIKNGLLAEVQGLKAYESLNTLKTVGYQELFPYLRNEISLNQAIEKIKQNTRRYAKRQLTWYRKKEFIHTLPYDLPEQDIIRKIQSWLPRH